MPAPSPRARRWPGCRCCASRRSRTLQAKDPPFGGFATSAAGELRARVHVARARSSSPRAHGEDWWRTARALFAAGFRKGDIVHNTFAYHLTPGGWILDAGARALGCAVIAGRHRQHRAAAATAIQYLQARRPTSACPTILKILLDKAKEAGKDVSCFKKALVGGGALFPLAARRVQGSAASTPTRPTPPPTSASSPTRARRSRA